MPCGEDEERQSAGPEHVSQAALDRNHHTCSSKNIANPLKQTLSRSRALAGLRVVGQRAAAARNVNTGNDTKTIAGPEEYAHAASKYQFSLLTKSATRPSTTIDAAQVTAQQTRTTSLCHGYSNTAVRAPAGSHTRTARHVTRTIAAATGQNSNPHTFSSREELVSYQSFASHAAKNNTTARAGITTRSSFAARSVTMHSLPRRNYVRGQAACRPR